MYDLAYKPNVLTTGQGATYIQCEGAQTHELNETLLEGSKWPKGPSPLSPKVSQQRRHALLDAAPAAVATC